MFSGELARGRLRVNAGRSKVMVFERKEVEVVNFGSVPVDVTGVR